MLFKFLENFIDRFLGKNEDYADEILNSRKNIIIVAKDNEPEKVNKAFLNFFNVSNLDEFKKNHRCICEFFSKEDGFLYGDDWIEKILNNENEQYKVKIIKDNQEYIFKIDAAKYKDKIILTLTDITKLINQQRKLKEVNELLDQYKKAVDELMIVSKTDTKGIITYVNKNFCEISGYSEKELLGKSHNIVRHPDMPKGLFKNMWDTIKRGELWRGFIKNRRKDGGYYWVDTGIMPIKNYKGEIVEYIAIRSDITYLIESIKRAKDAEKAKSMFLANMSHEIRTPLNAILGFTQLLEKKSNLDPESQKYIRIINSSANTLLKIINDVLDLSKIESGNISIDKKEFNPNKVFSDVAVLFLAKAKEKKINYKIDIDKLPDCILSDEHRLKQVIANLIGNAVKFTPEDGEIVVSVKKIDEDDKKVKMRFSVKDTGIGIPKDKQKEIFKAFSQADGNIIKQFGGTGLGLTISSKIVQKLGGNIEVESEEGKGSEFYFTLEFEKCDKVIEEEKKDEKNFTFKAKILVAEDDEFNQELIKAILNNFEIDYDIVSNGEEAIQKVKNNNYDLIFLDINMPKMSGLEAIGEIKKLTKTPIIALTANAFKEDVEKYFKAGFDDYISKPIKLDELERVFSKYLKKEEKSYLSNLQDSLNLSRDILMNLVDIYFKNVSQDLRHLEKSIKNKDFEEIRKYAHKIKGSSLNLKLDEIGKIASEMEKNSKEKNSNFDYEENLMKIEKLLENIEKEIK